MTDKTKDLILHHKFTDRGGSEVYDAFSIDDRLGMENPLFEIRINMKRKYVQAEVEPVHGSSQVESHGTG